MEIGAAGSVTLELTAHLRARPAAGWLACRMATRYVTNGYHEEDFEIWDSRGHLVAQARQLALLREPEPLHLVDQAPVVCGLGVEENTG